MKKIGRRALTVASAFAVGSAAMSVLNRITTPTLAVGPPDPIFERVTAIIPARNEETRLPNLIDDLRAQSGIKHLRVVIYDDRSTDRTASLAEDAAGGDSRFTIVRGEHEPPDGWLGKSAACNQAARHSDSTDADILIFLDADVRLGPDALAAAVTELRRSGASLLSPWPTQIAVTAAELIVQPLLCWSWAATLPTLISNAVTAPSMAVACGQFLVFDASNYRQIGGHHAVAASVTEDLDLARALRAAGLRTVVALAGEHVSCRMYSSATELREGYGKWLGTAFGSPTSTAVVLFAAAGIWIAPAVTVVCGSGRVRSVAAIGYAAGILSRLASRNMETRKAIRIRDIVDAAAHPLSIAAAIGLAVDSSRRHRLGRATWKGRTIP
ncbi:glycosyltransferase family 2 protein [Rhodococcus sp. ARC_M6]|uniref:glycosyltransferase n=1 Tax=Rhodococcus sp. ARC_M6 TaxID=2928852 RepID=UPI001FB249AA|nr:glycosyltransferase family 2 protein [Rhodococcus sp. ARC_M6]MCJ0903773.1 glycosyltransferase [Rhodococcus sp. ARC_M6]